jgi:hypothetical protein
MEMQYDAEIGHLHVPNVVARFPSSDGAFYSVTNSSGFRSNSDFRKARGARPRILVFGDSFTAGQESDNEQRYSDQLAQMLDAEVYNFGLSGSAPDQQLLIFEKYGREFDADLIVWGLTIHNVERVKMRFRPTGDRISGKTLLMPKPYFTFDTGVLNLHHVPVPRERTELDVQAAQSFEDVQAEPNALQRMVDSKMLRPMVEATRQFGLTDRLRSALYRATGVQMYDDYCDPTSDGWRLLEAIIHRFVASAGNTPVLLAPLPTYHYLVDKLKPVYDPLFASLAGAENGPQVCCLTSDLVANKSLNERKKICTQSGGHYTPYGNREVATLLANRIKQFESFRGASNRSAGSSETLNRVEKDQSLYVLGLSVGGRGSSAVLLRDGDIVAAGVEEQFNRILAYGGFPSLAINYCLEQARIHSPQLAAVAVAEEHSNLVQDELDYNGRIICLDDVASNAAEKTPRSSVEAAVLVAASAWTTLSGLPGVARDDARFSAALGPGFSDSEVFAFLDMYQCPHTLLAPEAVCSTALDLLGQGMRLGFFAGRAEFGDFPHGGRAIYANSSASRRRDTSNDEIEFRKISVRDLGVDPGGAESIVENFNNQESPSTLLYAPLKLKGEPVALTPFDAYRTVMLSGTEALLLGNHLVMAADQPAWPIA